jgi:mannose-6-phosphate isomerase-like protein (cupin superfamily)
MENNLFFKRMAAGWNIQNPWNINKTPHTASNPGLKKKGFVDNIEKRTLSNKDFRHVIYTAKHTQLVLMSLNPGEDIGEEIHSNVDQFFRVESGTGIVEINHVKHKIGPASAIIVPFGALHNVINTGRIPLKLYTLYAPPHHADGIVRTTKAMANDPRFKEKFTGKTTE